MVWGFPLSLKSKKTGTPPKAETCAQARAAKPDSFMWKHSFAERRCLIPVTQLAEAEGAKRVNDPHLVQAAQEAGVRRRRDPARHQRVGPDLFDGDDRRLHSRC